MAGNVTLVALARTAYAVYRQCWQTQEFGALPSWGDLPLDRRTCWLAAVTAVVGQLDAAQEEAYGG